MKNLGKTMLRGMKRRRKETGMLTGVLVLAFAFCIIGIIIQESYMTGKAQQRYEQYGEWMEAVCDAESGTDKILKEDRTVNRFGKLLVMGNAYCNGERLGKLGMADDNMISQGKFSMKEGRFPREEREIAVEEHVMSLLPGHIKVGDQVEISTFEGNVKEEVYTLTGVIKEWGNQWMVDQSFLPDILTSSTKTVEAEVISYFFTREEEIYSEKLFDWLKKNNSIYVYNNKAYPQNIGTMELFFLNGIYSAVIVLIAAILIMYALNLSMGRRRYRIQIMRGMGASVRQIIYISLGESIVILMRAIAVGSAFGGILVLAIVSVGKYILKWRIHLTVNIVLLLQSVFAIVIIFVISVVLLSVYLSTIPLSTAFRDDNSMLGLKSLPTLTKVNGLNIFRMCKRNRRIYKKQTYMRIMFSIGVICMMSISLYVFKEKRETYQFWREQESNDYHFSTEVLTDGCDVKMIEELERVPGVLSIDRLKFLNASGLGEIRIGWDGWRGSEYVTTHRRYTQVQDAMQKYDKEGDYFSLIELRGVAPDDREKLTYYKEAVEEGEFHEDRFNAGEECVLFLSPYQIKDRGGQIIDYDPIYITEPGPDKSKPIYIYEQRGDIKAGDQLQISTPWGDSSIAVGGIVYDRINPGEQVIAVGERFLDSFFKTDTSKVYNEIVIHSYAKANFAETDWKVNEVFRTRKKEKFPVNERIVYGEIAGQFASEMFQASAILLIIGMLYILILYQQNIIYMENEKRRVGIFRSLGMSRKQFLKKVFCDVSMDACVISSVSLGGMGIYELIRLRMETSFDSWSTFVKALTEYKDDIKVLGCAWLMVIVYYLCVYIVIVCIPLIGLIKENILENMKESV